MPAVYVQNVTLRVRPICRSRCVWLAVRPPFGVRAKKMESSNDETQRRKNGDIFPDLGPRLPESHSIGALIVHKVVRLHHLVRYFLNALL